MLEVIYIYMCDVLNFFGECLNDLFSQFEHKKTGTFCLNRSTNKTK